VCSTLDVDERAGREPTERFQALRGTLHEIAREGRIEKDHPERLRGAAKKIKRIGNRDTPVGPAPLLQDSVELARRDGVVLDEIDAPCAPRKGFESEHPTAGEQVEAMSARDPSAEPVEQCLAHAIRRRPDLETCREAQPPAAPRATDDAQEARARAARVRFRSAFSIDAHRSSLLAAPHRYNRGMIFRRDERRSDSEERQGFFKRLRARLNRGNTWLSFDLADLFRGRKIDAEILEELETRLLTADVGVEATNHILAGLNRRVERRELADVAALITALRDSISELLAPCARPLVIDDAHKPFVILVVGVNGSGKTTTIGKLARRLGDEGRSVMLAAGDTFRAAAIEQLEIWAKRTGAAFAAQQTGADPGAVMFDSMQAARTRRIDVLLADTAGRLQSQSHLMEELRKVKRVIQRVDATAPHEVLLVLDANQGQNALVQAQQFHQAIGVTGIVLTKLDGTAKGGIVIAIARKLGLPIRFIGIGEQADDFGELDAQNFAAALVEGVGARTDSAPRDAAP
jgi:fused signal recognition particle receptor